MELRSRIALVTGAGRRIGRAIAVALGARGMRVAVHHNASPDEARETVRLIEAAGGSAEIFVADLTGPDAPGRLVESVAAAMGGLDVLVNSAAVMRRTPVDTVTPGEWDAMFALNLRAPFFCAQAAARVMRAAGRGEAGAEPGAIVNIADLAAFETWRHFIPHSITKAGVVQMTRALAHALAPAVRVNAVAPGAVLLPDGWPEESTRRLVETTPLRRLGTPADVTGAVLYLLEADFLTGETIVVDGGRHVRR
jgi:pteridine reductase